MKYVIVFALVALVAWQWRAARERLSREQKPKPPQQPIAQNMVACNHCGVHIPAKDAVQGALGHYCDTRHRAAVEH